MSISTLTASASIASALLLPFLLQTAAAPTAAPTPVAAPPQGTTVPSGMFPSDPLPPDKLPPEFAHCIDELRVQALSAGVDAAVFDRHVRPLTPDLTVLPLLDKQPEFSTPIWDYLSGLVDQERVDDGESMLSLHAQTLSRVAAQYGVDAPSVVAVWGVESNFGRNFGKRPLLVSLTTLSCLGRRQAFFRGELISALQIVQSGDIEAQALVGSWAGAFGHTQFMPSTFQRIAVDGDGDGRRDLVASVPDALASTANFLKVAGWRSGEPWGYEVRLPEGAVGMVSGRTERLPLASWTAQGIVRADGGAITLPPSTPAALLLPAGRQGPAFLVFRNFDAIYSYNAAESYALAIALLSDRLRGGSGLRTPWPTPDPGLSRSERRELQVLLLARGHAIGEADGMIGTLSRQAIQQEQLRLGLQPVDGRAGLQILRALRAGVPSATPATSPAGAPVAPPPAVHGSDRK